MRVDLCQCAVLALAREAVDKEPDHDLIKVSDFRALFRFV
jgi:hypothetical protein